MNMSKKDQIRNLLLKGELMQKDIARIVKVSEGYVSRINSDLEKEKWNKQNLVYFEYLDHAVLDKEDSNDLPILASVGFITHETDKSLVIKQIWSVTSGEVFRKAIIFKDAIIKRIPFKAEDKQ